MNWRFRAVLTILQSPYFWRLFFEELKKLRGK